MKDIRSDIPQIVVIGGGFAGLNFIQHLKNSKHYHITLVDKNNYNYFTPLLYQVATSFLEPSNISYPFRKLFRHQNVSFRMASIRRIDTVKQVLLLSDGGELPYDVLVIAAGVHTNFFGNESIRKNAISLKGIDDAIRMRNKVMETMEKAVVEQDPKEKQKLLTVVIAGGGPTGVEVAGMLAEMRKYICQKDYPELDLSDTKIYVVDGAPVLLAPMSEKTHQEAYRVLKELEIEIKLNTRVEKFENDQVLLSDGTVIETKSLIWTAGVTANKFEGIDSESLGKGNRMLTDQYNQVKGYQNIYAIGDISLQYTDEDYPQGHPQMAQPAIQQGKTLAKNLIRVAKGQPMKAFKYFDKGDMAIIGRNFAVADLFKHKVHIGGILGLLSWLFIHIASLVNYNNIVKTFYNWTVAYITRDQALRMIFWPERKDKQETQPEKLVESFKEKDYA